MLASAAEDMSEHGVRLGEIWIELYGYANQLIGPIKGGRAQVVAIERIHPRGGMRERKHGIGARTTGVQYNGLLCQTTYLVKLSRLDYRPVASPHGTCPQTILIRPPGCGRFAQHTLAFGLVDVSGKDGDDHAGHFVLHCQD